MVIHYEAMRMHLNRGLLWILLFAAAPVAAADITVTTDRDPASLNESFQIVFEADSSPDGDPDFSPLDKDFQVLSSSQSSNISITNGNFTSSRKWVLNVLARRAGTLTIPSVAFGNDQSPRSSIEVINGYVPGNGARNPGRRQAQAGDKDVYLEVSAEPKDPYVQSQVRYTVKLYLTGVVSNASLSEPEVTKGNAVVERVGKDKDYETSVGGRRYRVKERHFVIYPQASGRMTIEPLRFQARYSTSAFSLFDPFGPQPRSIARQSSPVTLDVRPIPAGFSGDHWLPAKSVHLTETWSVDPPAFKVGEPITRTLTITANGVTASQLPEIQHWQDADFKQYPDQPVLNDNEYGGGIVGGRQEKIAVIPSRPGDFVIPAITIPWWNTTTDKIEYAQLPERKITVLAAAGSAGREITPARPAPLPEINPAQIGKGAADGQSESPQPVVPVSRSSRFWMWLSIALGVIWLVTVIAWWLSRYRRAPMEKGNGVNAGMNTILKELKKACAGNDPERTKELLLQWARLNWPKNPPRSLGETGKRCGSTLKQEIDGLNNALYGKGGEAWDGGPFWRVFSGERPQNEKPGEEPKGKLEPLFRI